MLPTDPLNSEDVLVMLRDLMASSESDTARIQAAKILLERLAPKQDDEQKNNEARERDAAFAEARGLLAEFASLKLAFFRLSREVADRRETAANNAAGELANMADSCG